MTDKDRPNDIDGCYDFAEDVTAEDLGRLAPMFPPNPEGRVEAKRRFGVDFFPTAATELGSGQPFLRFFQTDREGRERGACSLWNCERGGDGCDPQRQGIPAQQGAALRA